MPDQITEIEQTWTTDQLVADFNVRSFFYGVVFVTRRSDGVQGSLTFVHDPSGPRIYRQFRED